MEFKRFRVTIIPCFIVEGYLELKIEAIVDNKVYTIREVKEPDYFLSYWDIIFDSAKKEIKKMIDEEKSDGV